MTDELQRNVVWQGDSAQVLRMFPPNTFDAIITDPPRSSRRLTIKCDCCGKLLSRPISIVFKNNFCNQKCRNQFMRKISDSDVEKIKALYLSGKSSIALGEQFGVNGLIIIKYLKRAGVDIRSGTEHMATNNPTKGVGHTVETKEKLRQAANKQFSDPKQRTLAAHNQCEYLAKNKKRAVSKLEDKVAAWFDAHEVKYDRQEPIRDPKTGIFRACVDFLIDGMVVEVNGTFWHADPRVYPNGPKCESQRKTATAYGKKVVFLKSINMEIIEVWELDVDKDIDAIMKLTMTKIQNRKGDLS